MSLAIIFGLFSLIVLICYMAIKWHNKKGQLVYFMTNIDGLNDETFEKYIHPAHIKILALTQTGQVDKIKPLIDNICFDVLYMDVENLRTFKNILELSKIDNISSDFYFEIMNVNSGCFTAVIHKPGGKMTMVNLNIRTQDNVKKWQCYYVKFISRDMK